MAAALSLAAFSAFNTQRLTRLGRDIEKSERQQRYDRNQANADSKMRPRAARCQGSGNFCRLPHLPYLSRNAMTADHKPRQSYEARFRRRKTAIIDAQASSMLVLRLTASPMVLVR